MAYLTWSSGSAASESTLKTYRPNFVFIFADYLGWGELGCYSNRQIKTPNLDKLAQQGMLFTQFNVNSLVCSTSWTSIIISHFPVRHCFHGHFTAHAKNKDRGMPDWLDPKVCTVTGLLQKTGYVTGHSGKWHLGSGKGAPGPGEYGIACVRSNFSESER